MIAAALFDDRDGLFDFAGSFKITQIDYGIAQVAQVHRSIERSYESVLRQNRNRHEPLLIQICKQFVKLTVQIFFSRHCCEITIETVDDEKLRTRFDAFANKRHEFARGNFGRVYLPRSDHSTLNILL